MLCTMCMFGTTKTWECEKCKETMCGHIWKCTKCGKLRSSRETPDTLKTLRHT